MTLYALWANWTTLYFVQERHMAQADVNRQFAWIPPVFATAGGFFGAVMSYRWIRGGMNVLRARMRICWISAVILLGTATVPLMPTPALAAAAISLSFFWTLAISTNAYSLPIDLFGTAHAGLAIAVLGSSFGLMTAVLSPWIGSVVDRVGFAPVCVVLSMMPLVGVAILRWTLKARNVKIRPARLADLAVIAAIQAASPEAAQWNPADYLKHHCRVCEVKGCVAGFLVTREVGPGEREILNLAVDPAERRTGIARGLLANALESAKGAWFLEVRASNAAAIRLYESAGFHHAGRRPEYYYEPAEDGIVMRFVS